jgi:hypothetical protein
MAFQCLETTSHLLEVTEGAGGGRMRDFTRGQPPLSLDSERLSNFAASVSRRNRRVLGGPERFDAL